MTQPQGKFLSENINSDLVADGINQSTDRIQLSDTGYGYSQSVQGLAQFQSDGTHPDDSHGSGQVFQFEREGYFVADRYDHSDQAPVFNMTIGLRDSWGGG